MSSCQGLAHSKCFGLSEKYPDCPNNILRNHFKREFKNMSDNHTSPDYFMLDFSAYTSPLLDRNVYYMPYQSFYTVDTFLNEVTKIKEFFNEAEENDDRDKFRFIRIGESPDDQEVMGYYEYDQLYIPSPGICW